METNNNKNSWFTTEKRSWQINIKVLRDYYSKKYPFSLEMGHRPVVAIETRAYLPSKDDDKAWGRGDSQ